MHTPRKRFGQHFLCDQNVIQNIVAAIQPKPDDRLVEIGPGQGALTFPLLQQCQVLDAVELDRDLIAYLEQRAQPIGELIIHQSDVLDFDFSKLYKKGHPLRVVGNLPYNISTPLIFHLLSYADLISDMVFMLQKEVAERLAAPAGSPHIGRLSIMVQYYCEVEVLFDVAPDAFYPPPKVDSSILQLKPHKGKPYVAKNTKLFADIVKQAFGQRRKTLRKSLKDLISPQVWAQSNISSDLRPETLGVKEFVALANLADAE